MSKLRWSAKGFARRVSMGLEGIWLVVEGRDHDRVHYGRLMKRMEPTKKLRVSLRLAEQIHVDGVSAGGKKHVLNIYDEFTSRSSLVQKGSHGQVITVFMLDRDRDDYEGAMVDSPHVIYTFGTDAEADIMNAGDIWRAAESAYGIDDNMLRSLAAKVPDPRSALHQRWDRWTLFGLIALGCRQQGCAPWGQPSMVNDEKFGIQEAALVDAVERRLRDAVGDETFGIQELRARAHINSHGVRLLKGRLIAAFVDHLVREELSGHIIRSGVKPATIIDTAIETMSYSGTWFEEYERSFAKVLAEAQNAPAPADLALAT